MNAKGKPRSIVLIMATLMMAACASEPEVIEPQQARQSHQVACKYWLQKCHLKARKTCKRGYNIIRSIRVDKTGGPYGSYKSYKMLFTCN